MEKINENEEVVETKAEVNVTENGNGKKHRKHFKFPNGKKMLRNACWFLAGAVATVGAAMLFGGDKTGE